MGWNRKKARTDSAEKPASQQSVSQELQFKTVLTLLP